MYEAPVIPRALLFALLFALPALAADVDGGAPQVEAATDVFPPGPPTFDTVALDREKFLGRWFEIARYDMFFERGCVAVTSTYTRIDEADLKVVNRCVKDKLDGPVKNVEGKSWAPDPQKEPGKLKIQFFWPFSGDFWVLDVAPDYSWALVGNGKKSSAWIFSRTSTLPEPLYLALVARLKARGYDPAKLLRIPQRPNE